MLKRSGVQAVSEAAPLNDTALFIASLHPPYVK